MELAATVLEMDIIEQILPRDLTIIFYCYIYTFYTNPSVCILLSILNGNCTTSEGCFPIRCGTVRPI